MLGMCKCKPTPTPPKQCKELEATSCQNDNECGVGGDCTKEGINR